MVNGRKNSNSSKLRTLLKLLFDEGLRIDSWKHGLEHEGECQNCKTIDGRKLTKELVQWLSHRFFVLETTIRFDYGAAPRVQFNEQHFGISDISLSQWLKNDVKLLEDAGKIGFFHYGPRFWMFGEVYPLIALQEQSTRADVIKRILAEYPERKLTKSEDFYRVRVNPKEPSAVSEYDSPPANIAGGGRLCAPGFAVMYGSQDIDICIHECRAAAEDDMYVATLQAALDLRLLDLTAVLKEEVSEFESLDMAVHMLFLAKSHSYEISRDIAIAVRDAGFDGVIYPSYFSLLRTGGQLFETAYGLSLRRFHPQAEQYAKTYMMPNFALFGRPIEQGKVTVKCLNRIVLTQIGYLGHFGPVAY